MHSTYVDGKTATSACRMLLQPAGTHLAVSPSALEAHWQAL
jgi:hypothetical protein